MKVYPFVIPKPSGKHLVVEVDRGEAFFDKLHRHDEIQISLIVSGRGTLFAVDGIHPFRPGDLFLIGGGNPHFFRSQPDGPCHMVSVFFTREAFGDGFFDTPELTELRPVLDKATASYRLTSHRKQARTFMLELPDAGSFDRFILLLRLLKTLSGSRMEPVSEGASGRRISSAEGQRLQSVFEFATRNFREEMRLEQVAALAHLTPNAFCRFFKQRTRKTFFRFLTELRIEHSRQLLAGNREMPIGEVARASGFNSITRFNRQFRELCGCTPGEFRKKGAADTLPPGRGMRG